MTRRSIGGGRLDVRALQALSAIDCPDRAHRQREQWLDRQLDSPPTPRLLLELRAEGWTVPRIAAATQLTPAFVIRTQCAAIAALLEAGQSVEAICNRYALTPGQVETARRGAR